MPCRVPQIGGGMSRVRKPRSWGAAILFWSPLVLLIVAGFWVTTRFIEPAPPNNAVIMTGQEDGEYFASAQKYVDVFKQNGIALQVKPSAGSIENYQALLRDDPSAPDLAIVQGGTLSPEIAAGGKLESIASIYLEPLWVFHRDPGDLTSLSELKGKRVAIGLPGSGTRALATRLLAECGANPITANDVGGTQAAAMLKAGEIDALLIVSSPKSPVIVDLLGSDGIKLMSNAQANGLARRLPFLSVVTLYRGSIDPARNLPAGDVTMLAPTAIIVARRDTHKSVVLLTAMAATEVHKPGTLLNEPGQFPTARYTELPLSRNADYFLKSGPTFFARIFPFWLASILQRMMILLLPLLGLLIPLVRATPPLYQWRVRSRIYRWYKQVDEIDQELGQNPNHGALQSMLKRVHDIEHDIREVHVPLSYMEDLYHLRLHVELIESKVRQALSAPSDGRQVSVVPSTPAG